MIYTANAQMTFSLPDGRDFILLPGNTVELPEDNSHVKSLAAQGLLTAKPEAVELVPVKQEEPKAPAAETPSAPVADKPKVPAKRGRRSSQANQTSK